MIIVRDYRKFCRGYEVRITTEFIPENNPGIPLKEYNQLYPINDNLEKYDYVYVDTNELVNAVDDRSCAECGMEAGKNEPDPCMGKLDGVFCACCGHGKQGEAYIKFNNGVVLRGKGAVDFIESNK